MMRTSAGLTVIGLCVWLGNGRGNAAEPVPVRGADDTLEQWAVEPKLIDGDSLPRFAD